MLTDLYGWLVAVVSAALGRECWFRRVLKVFTPGCVEYDLSLFIRLYGLNKST